VRKELLQDHLRANAGTYDVVCAFQVIEHVEAPLPLFAEMVQAARPGGLVIVTVPYLPSAMMRIPNFLLNAPPHHLTWWTRESLAALATEAGAEVDAIERVGWDRADSLIYWIERCSPIRCKREFFRSSLLWHTATVLSFAAGVVLHRLKGVPSRKDEGSSLMLVARRPQSH
jgi:SAM-dependent methyltransferase